MTTATLSPIKLRTTIYRACRRCGGTLRLEQDVDSVLDHDSYDYVCLQCGHHTPLAAVLTQRQA